MVRTRAVVATDRLAHTRTQLRYMLIAIPYQVMVTILGKYRDEQMGLDLENPYLSPATVKTAIIERANRPNGLSLVSEIKAYYDSRVEVLDFVSDFFFFFFFFF